MPYCLAVPAYIAAHAVKQAAAAHAKLPDDGRKAGQRPHSLAAVAMALHAIGKLQHCGLRRSITTRQGNNCLGWNARDRRGTLRRILSRALAQFAPANGIRLQPGFISQSLAEEDMHDAQRQRSIRGWIGLDMLVG